MAPFLKRAHTWAENMFVHNLDGVSSNDVGSVFGSRGYSSLDDHGSRELMDFDVDGDDWAAYIFIANTNGQHMCMQAGSEPSLVEIDQYSIIVTWLEMLMFFASCVAAYRHFKDAGSRISSATRFFIVHVIFSGGYAACHMSNQFMSPCLCSPMQLMSMLYHLMYNFVAIIFIAYWDKAMRQVTEVRYMWEYRVIYFSLVYISQAVTFIFGLSQKPCRRENFEWPFNYCMSLYFGGYMVDAAMLFLRCRARVKAQIWPRGRTARGLKHPMLSYLRHVAPFACLPICYALGVLLINAQKNMRVEALKRTDWVWQFFAYFLPSNIMLPIMWRRRYLDVSDRNVGGIVDDWRLSNGMELVSASGHVKMGAKSTRNLLSRQPLQLEGTGFDAGICFDELDAGLVRCVAPRYASHVLQANASATNAASNGPYGGGYAASAASAAAAVVARNRLPSSANVGRELASESRHGVEWGENKTLMSVNSLPAVKLHSEIAGNNEDAVEHQGVDAQGSSNYSARDASAAAELTQPQSNAVGANEAKAVVKEALVPPSAGLVVVQGFLLNCVLPQLERGYIDHCRRVKKLLISAAPKTAAEAAGPTEGAALEATELGQMAAASTGTTNGVNPMAAVQATDMFGAFERQHLFENLKLKAEHLTGEFAAWVATLRAVAAALPAPSSLKPATCFEARTAAAAAARGEGFPTPRRSQPLPAPALSSAGKVDDGVGPFSVAEASVVELHANATSDLLNLSALWGSNATSTVGPNAQQSLFFKPSKQKKSTALAHISTNLQVHSTLFVLYPSTTTRTYRSITVSTPTVFAATNELGIEVVDQDAGANGVQYMGIDIITMGAPACHALGFKHGGLRDVERVFEKLNTSLGSAGGAAARFRSGSVGALSEDATLNASVHGPLTESVSAESAPRSFSKLSIFGRLGSTNTADPEAQWQQKSQLNQAKAARLAAQAARTPEYAMRWLSLDFERRAREGAVLSQALGACVTAALDRLKTVVEEGLGMSPAMASAQAPVNKHHTSKNSSNNSGAAKRQDGDSLDREPHVDPDAAADAARAKVVASFVSGAVAELPPGWSRHVDPSSGKTYYASIATGETDWFWPGGAEAEAHARALARTKAEAAAASAAEAAANAARKAALDAGSGAGAGGAGAGAGREGLRATAAGASASSTEPALPVTKMQKVDAGTAAKRWGELGLLVHSVCLLSTHGNEVGMLDDFAGAYERLDVSLVLVKEEASDAGTATATATGVGPAVAGAAATAADVSKGRADPERVRLTVKDVQPVDKDAPRRGNDGQPHASGKSGLGRVVVTVSVGPPEAAAWLLKYVNAFRGPDWSPSNRSGGNGGGRTGSMRNGSLRQTPDNTGILRGTSGGFLSSLRTTAATAAPVPAPASSSAQPADFGRDSEFGADSESDMVVFGRESEFGGGGGDFARQMESHPTEVRDSSNFAWASGKGFFGGSSSNGAKSNNSLRFSAALSGSTHQHAVRESQWKQTIRRTHGSGASMAGSNNRERQSSTTAASGFAVGFVGEIKLKPVLFNVGVNEMQSVAIATKSNLLKKQAEINRAGLEQLASYVEESLSQGLTTPDLADDIEQRMSQLYAAVAAEAAKPEKSVNILMLSSQVARRLGGARTTSCKSAKDRTSVFTTLEVATEAVEKRVVPSGIAPSSASSQNANNHSTTSSSNGYAALESLKPDDEHAVIIKVANELRGENGVRLGNCEDNVGRPKYSFNGLQVQALPPDLRPPAHTATGGAS